MSIGLLVPDLEYRHHARQTTRIVQRLNRQGVPTRVLSLKAKGPLEADLPADSLLPILNNKRLIPPAGFTELLHWLRSDSPEILHVWGSKALRLFAIVKTITGRQPRLIFSPLIGEKLSRLDRLVLKNCEKILVPHPDFPGCASFSKVEVLPPIESETTPDNAKPSWQPPQDAKLIVIVGRMDSFEAFKDALWAFDILRRVDPHFHLVVIGDGPARQKCEDFQSSIGSDHSQVHFLGAERDSQYWLGNAAIVWLPFDRKGGVHRLKEALASNVSIIVPRLQHLLGLTLNQSKIVSYEPEDAVDLARKTLPQLQSFDLERVRPNSDRIGGAFEQADFVKIYGFSNNNSSH